MLWGPAKSLPVPRAVKKNRKAVEIVRIWTAKGVPHFVLRPDQWDDPAAWGILLADLARQVVSVHEARTPGLDGGAMLERIRSGFEEEMASPTE
jgi:hypothetical protein